MAHTDIEKTTPSLREEVHHDGSSHDELESEFTLKEQRKIVHRVDRRLVVTVGILYCISLMDRTNLSAASIAGSVCPIPWPVHITKTLPV